MTELARRVSDAAGTSRGDAGSSRLRLGEDMTDNREDRWWPQALGLAAGALSAGARALGNGRPPLLRWGLGAGAVCLLAALIGLVIERIRATRRGRRSSAAEAADGEPQRR